MAKLTGQTFKATLVVANNPTSGESYLLRTDEEVAEFKAVALADMAERMDILKRSGTVEAIISAQTRMEQARIDASFARQVAERDAAMKGAKKYEYTIIKPSYGEYTEAEGKATTYAFDGDIQFSRQAFVNLLFADALEGVDAATFNGLDPVIGRELRFRFERSLFPDSKRLPFT